MHVQAGVSPENLSLILDPVKRESALLATYLTCVYMAAKVVETVPAPRLLPIMLHHVYAQPVSTQQVRPHRNISMLQHLHDPMGWQPLACTAKPVQVL